jgi:hypothetical protein
MSRHDPRVTLLQIRDYARRAQNAALGRRAEDLTSDDAPPRRGAFVLYCRGRRVACFANDHALADRELEIGLRSGMVRV